MPKKTAVQVAGLTPREIEVLKGIADDKTYAQIAHNIKLSYDSVKSYANRLRAKLGCDTKVGLALWAAKNL